MPDRHLQRPISIRPPKDDRAWLEVHARETGRPVRAIIVEALARYRAEVEAEQAHQAMQELLGKAFPGSDSKHREHDMNDIPQPGRANRDGHLCPPWCETDHDMPVGTRGLRAGWHGTGPPPISTPSGYVTASAYQDGFGDAPPQVWIGALNMPGGWTIAPADAERLAVLAEQLADATPDQHRELAAAIRKAAAQVTEAGDG